MVMELHGNSSPFVLYAVFGAGDGLVIAADLSIAKTWRILSTEFERVGSE